MRPVRVGNLGTRSLIRDSNDLSVCKARMKFEIQIVIIGGPYCVLCELGIWVLEV